MPARPGPPFAHTRLAVIAALVLCAHLLALWAVPGWAPPALPGAAPLSVVVLPAPLQSPVAPTRAAPAPARAAVAASQPAAPSAPASAPAAADAPQTPASAAAAAPPAPATVFSTPASSALAPGMPVPAGAAGTAGTPLASAANAAPAAAAAAPAGGAPAASATGRSEGPTLDAQYLHTPPLDYPRISRQRGEQGRVLVQVLVGADGLPQKTVLQASSGFARLDQAALESVMRWRFVPGRRDGVAQTMWYTVPVQFVLQ